MFGLPALPLLLAWRALIQEPRERLTTMAIVILTVSYLWVLAVLAAAPLIAPHYTAARSTTIDVNVVAVLVAIVLVIIGRRFRWKLLLTGFGVLALWAYIGFVSSVV